MMKNHFEVGYEFTTETGEKRYIAFVDYDCGVPHYDTYPVAIRSQLEADLELLFDYDFVDKYRICMEEHELYELKIKQCEAILAEYEKKVKECEAILAASKISVSTPMGVLEACIGGDPDYPEIFTYIRRPDEVEIDLVAVEVKTEENIARAYLYGDTMTDSYTKTHDWSAEEINVEVD